MKQQITKLFSTLFSLLLLVLMPHSTLFAQYNIGGANQDTGNITNDDEVCSGETVIIAAGIIAGNETYNWSDASIGDNQTFNRAFTSNETFTVTITDGGEEVTQVISLVVNALPTPNITPTENAGTANDGIICPGDDVTLDSGVGGATTYAWSDGGGSNQTASYTSLTANTTYTVTVTNSDGCTGTDEFEVTVDDPTVVTIDVEEDTGTPNDGGFCLNQFSGIKIIATPGFTNYEWNVAGLNTHSFSYGAFPSTPVTTEFDFTVTVTNSAGCTATASTKTTADPLPTVSATSNSPVCGGGDLELMGTGSGGTDWAWSGPDSFTSTEQNPSISAATAAAEGDYTVTLTSNLGCESTATVATTISSASANIIASPSLGLCQGEEMIFDGGIHSSYQWLEGETTQTIAFQSVAQTSTLVKLFEVTVTDDSGCTAVSSVYGTFNGLPAFNVSEMDKSGTADDDQIICSGDAATLTASPLFNSTYSYQWSNGASTGSTEVTPSSTMVYTVTVTNESDCSDTATIAVSVNPISSANITVSPSAELCQGEEMVLDVGTHSSYQWLDGETTQTIAFQSVAQTSTLIKLFQVTVTDDNGCPAVSSVYGTFNGLPAFNVSEMDKSGTADDDQIICSGDAATLTASPLFNSTYSYQWSNGASTGSTEVTPSSTTVYTVTVTNESDCSDTATIAVSVNPLPNPQFNNNTLSDNLGVCSEESGVVYRLDSEFAKYEWSVVGGTVTNNPSNGNGGNGKHSAVVDWPQGSATGSVSVTVTDANACQAATSVPVTIFAPVLPTVTGTFEFCSGRTATLDAGAYAPTPNTYVWSTNETTQVIMPNIEAVYTVTVTDNNGCTGTASAETTNICDAFVTGLTLNNSSICPGGDVVSTVTTYNSDTDYKLQYILFSTDNLGGTTYVEDNLTGTFASPTPGNYTVCAYSELTTCAPNPSPCNTNLDDLADVGTILDGCYASICENITVPAPLEPIAGTGQATESNSTGTNVYIAEVCGGTPPYSVDFDSSGGFASVETVPSASAGCINYQIVYVDAADWTLTITDSNNCTSGEVVFSSDGTSTDPLPQITDYTVVKETCPNDFNGSINIEVEGGDDSCTDYSYSANGPNAFSESDTFAAASPTSSFVIDGLASGTYNVTVTDCGSTTTVQNIYVGRTGGNGGSGGGRARGRGGCSTNNGKTASNLLELQNFHLFPNPLTQESYLHFSLSEKAWVEVTIYTIEGKEVQQLKSSWVKAEETQVWAIPSKLFPSGIYILQLTSNTGVVYHERMMVE